MNAFQRGASGSDATATQLRQLNPVTRRHTPVSIGLPVYNGERYLKECLDSLLAQTFDDFELIISDNASTDRTEEICREYATREKRIKYFRNDANIGVNRNFNRLFQLSSGEYFKWACADDVCHRNLVAKCLEILERDQNVVLAYAKTTFIDDNGKALDLMDPGWNLITDVAHERLRYVIHSDHWVNAFYGLIRADSLAKTRLLPVYSGGDYRLLGELSLMGKFFELPDPLFYRRIHRNASSQNHSLEWESEFFLGNHGRNLLPLWQLCLDHSATIIRSQLGLGRKLSLSASVLRRMLADRNQLLRELLGASKHRLRGVLSFKSSP